MINAINEKLALMEWGQIWEPGLPLSPGVLGQGDRQQLLWDYPGILWGEGSSPPAVILQMTLPGPSESTREAEINECLIILEQRLSVLDSFTGAMPKLPTINGSNRQGDENAYLGALNERVDDLDSLGARYLPTVNGSNRDREINEVLSLLDARIYILENS